MLITSILTSTVFWLGASAYGIYSGYETIKNSKNNPNLTRSEAAYQYGYGTAEKTQKELIEFATKNNWNPGEIKKLEVALEYWLSALKTYE